MAKIARKSYRQIRGVVCYRAEFSIEKKMVFCKMRTSIKIIERIIIEYNPHRSMNISNEHLVHTSMRLYIQKNKLGTNDPPQFNTFNRFTRTFALKVVR